MQRLIRLLDTLWKILASLKTGIVLMGLLALVNLIGSFIIQEGQAQPGQLERAYSPETRAFLESLGLFDIYHSWWFVSLLCLTALSLIIASIDIWPRFWGRVVAWRPRLGTKELAAKNLKKYIKFKDRTGDEISKFLERFLKDNFAAPWTKQEGKARYFFSQKGRFSHLGVFVIHTGLVLILIGGFVGSRYGFEGQIKLGEGESSNIYFSERGAGPAQPLGFWIRCNDVRMETYPNGSPKAYYSDLDILVGGEIVRSKTIKVNDPFEYNNIYFYQASYGTEPYNEKLSFALSVAPKQSKQGTEQIVDFQQEAPLPGKKQGSGYFTVVDYIQQFQLPIQGVEHNLGEAVRIQLVDGKKEKNFWIFKAIPEFDREVRKGSYAFQLREVKYDYQVREFTGLQVGYNPGIMTVWGGSTILLIGLMWTFLGSHRKLWVQVQGNEISLAAQAHRNPERFTKTFDRLVQKMQKELNGTDSNQS